MNLKQIKADRTNGVLVSPATWDEALDHALVARDSALEEVIALMEAKGGRMVNAAWVVEVVRALRSNSAATGKPDGGGSVRIIIGCKRGNVADRDKFGHCLCADCKAFRYERSKLTKDPARKNAWVSANKE